MSAAPGVAFGSRLPRSALRLAIYGLAALLAVGWFAFLRPQWMGGPATYVIVRGSSMVPTYANGDLLFIQAQSDYKVGDVVGYHVPAGDVGAGQLVVHRILVVEPSGAYAMRGDNNSMNDPWEPTPSLVVGRVVASAPGAGGLMAVLMTPAVLAALATALVVMVLVAHLYPVRRLEPLPDPSRAEAA